MVAETMLAKAVQKLYKVGYVAGLWLNGAWVFSPHSFRYRGR
jgi:hypothetical protein